MNVYTVTFLNFQGTRATTNITAASFSVDNSVASGLTLFWDGVPNQSNLIAFFPSGRVESVIKQGV